MSLCTVSEIVNPDPAPRSFEPGTAEDTLSFFDAAWLHAWGQAFLPNRGWDRPLSLYCVASSQVRLGYVAFARRKVSALSVQSLAGYYWPLRTLVVRDDDEARGEFADAIAGHFAQRAPGAVLRFGPIWTSDGAMRKLLSALGAQGWKALQRPDGHIYELDLTGTPDDFRSRISPSLLRHVKYARSRLDRNHGSVAFERHVLGPSSGPVLETLRHIEETSWVAKESGDVKFVGDANRAFWTTLMQAKGRASDIVTWILRVGDRPIAFSAHVETRDTVFIIANGYDDQWKAFSPGSLLSHELLIDACRRGKKRVDWGIGDSGYKSRWGAQRKTGLADVMLFEPSLKGGLLHAAAQRALKDWESGQGPWETRRRTRSRGD
jgi:hypothetical protein